MADALEGGREGGREGEGGRNNSVRASARLIVLEEKWRVGGCVSKGREKKRCTVHVHVHVPKPRVKINTCSYE